MADQDAPARPRQISLAGWFVVGASIYLVLSVFDSLTRLQSVDTRDEVASVLSSASGEGLGLSVTQALSLMRWGMSIAAVCAAVAAVLGFFVLQRHRGARIALSVVAVPILVTSPLTGGLTGALVAAATAMLWSGPARDWFAGRPVRESAPLFGLPGGGAPTQRREDPHAPKDRHAAPPTPPAPAPSTSGERPPSLSTGSTSTAPGATSGYGAAPVQPAWQSPAPQVGYPHPQAPGQEAHGAPVPPQAWPVARTSPPVGVRAACGLAFVFSAVVALLYVAVIVVLVADRSRLVDLITESPSWKQANLDSDVLVPVLWFGCLMFLGWALGAMVLAFFTWRRHNWARYLLVASAGAAFVAAVFAFPFGLVHQLACAAAVFGLLNRPAREWFAARPPQHPGAWPGGPSAPTSGQQPPQSSDRPPVW